MQAVEPLAGALIVPHSGEIRQTLSGESESIRNLQSYPYLERDDIDQCLAYAAWRLEDRDALLHTTSE